MRGIILMGRYIRIFQQSFKSLFIIRNRDLNGNYKERITRLIRENRTAIVPVDPTIKEMRDVTDSIKLLFGDPFYKRSIFRYSFLRRFIFVPTLYPKARTIYRSDESLYKKQVKAELPEFRGTPKNRVLDLRNTVFDYSALIKEAFITDPKYTKRPNVMVYARDIAPEIISYFLFNSVHEESIKELDEVNDESIEELRVRAYERMESNDAPEYMSEEDFNLKLLSKTRTFSANGDGIGIEKYGFDSFIIPWKISSTHNRIAKREMISGDLEPRIIELKDPSIVYDMSIIQFCYKLYLHYYNNEISDNEFVNEFMKRRVIFYFYIDKGLGFTFDPQEIKEFLKWSPRRVLTRLSQLMNLFINCNRNIVSEKNINDLMGELDEDKEEMENGGPEIVEDVQKSKLNLDIKKLMSQYKTFNLFKKFIKSKADNENHVLELAKKKARIADIKPEKKENGFYQEETHGNISRIINQYKMSLREDDDVSVDETDDDEYEEEENESKREIEEIIEESDEEFVDESSVGNNSEFDESVEIETSAIDDKFVTSDIPLTKKQEKIVNAAKEKFKDIKIYENVSVQEMLEKPIPEINGDYNKYKKTLSTRDKSLERCTTVRDFSKSYIENKLDTDIINAVKSLEYSGSGIHFYITDIKISDTSTQFTRQKTYKFKLKDTNNKESNLVFDVPFPDDNGFLFINGNKYLFKKQNYPLPVVKIAPDNVMLTTHHQYKSFIKRHGEGFNTDIITMKKLFLEFFDSKQREVSVNRGRVVDGNKQYRTNFEYDEMANLLYDVTLRNKKSHIKIFFDQTAIRNEIENMLTNFNISTEDKKSKLNIPDNYMPYAIDYNTKTVHCIDLDKNDSLAKNIVILINNNLDNNESLKKFLLKVSVPKRRMFSEVVFMSRSCPLIIFLGSLYGITKVLKTAKIKYEFVEKKPSRTSDKRMFIPFSNGYLMYEQYPVENAILVNGLNYMKTENLKYEELDTPSPYMSFLEQKFGSRNVYKGWVSTEQFFIDPVTMKVLAAQGLPRTFLELFLYANMLLADNDYKKESSIQCYRLRQYEIVAEQLYQELYNARIEFQQRKGRKNSLSIKQNFMYKRLSDTNLLQNFDDSSPIMEAKGTTIVSMKGPGGTNLEEAFKLDKRSYGEDCVGIYSFGNTDSGTVGTLKQLSMNPKVTSTMGFYHPVEKSKEDNLQFTDLVSPEESIAPFVTRVDDPKRIIFLASQSVHVIPMDNELPIVRTGSEKTFPNLIGDTYCHKAKKDGKIVEVDEVSRKIYISYNDGTKEVVDYDTKLNKISNFFLENQLSPIVKKGQTVVSEQPVAVNSNFFKMENGKPLLTQGVLARVAVFESHVDDEDGSAMTQSMSERMSTVIDKRKQVMVKASSTIFDMKRVGDHVDVNDYLMSFDESGVTSTLNGKDPVEKLLGDLDEDTLASLRNSPKAGYAGIITDIRIYWTIPPEKMSPSCAKVVNDYIRKVKKECIEEEKFTGRPSFNRKKLEITVPKNNLINGSRVNKDGSVLIEFFIKHKSYMAPSDKVSYHSSIKSTISKVIPKGLEPYTETGKPIDFITSGMGVFRRMVNSIWITGFMGKVFDDVGCKIAEEFFNDLK